MWTHPHHLHRKTMPNDKSPSKPETVTQQETGGDCVSRLVRLSDTYWNPWFAELLKLAEHHGITTSDDADLWWDDFGAGKTPQESMGGFLASDEGVAFRNNSLPNDERTPTR